MDIHKPHAAKSWKEFFIELGTIVLGILIALSLEQAVESWREHQQYRESGDAMRAELGFDIFNVSRRDGFSSCLDRRMDEIGALLDKADKKITFTPPQWIGDPISMNVRFIAEPEASRSGLFSTAEQRRFGVLYRWTHGIDVDQELERHAWAQLQALEGRDSIPPELSAQMRVALAEARYEHNRMKYMTGFLKRGAQLYGIKLATRYEILNPQPDVWSYCLPMNTPRPEALRRSGWNFRE